MTINESQDRIIDEFSLLNDWFEKYEYLIELGKAHTSIDEKLKTDTNTLSGCQSKVWLKAEIEDNKVSFLADSDAMITRGLIALLLKVLNYKSPQEIVDSNLYFIDKIELSSNLSPARSNGLTAIINGLKACGKSVA